MTRSLRLSWTALVGPLVLAALLLFTLTAAFVQVLRRDLDWMVATLSLYLHGPGGLALRVAYCVLALAMVLLALALYRQPPPALRRGLPLALFVVAAIGLCTVAIGDSYLPAAAPLLAPLVHAVSAQAAFLCVTCAMLLQAWRLRGIRRWRPYQRWFWYWAWLSFAALWLHVGWRASPRGLGQKWVIAMVLVWLSAAAWRLWRLPHAEAVLERGSSDNGSDIHPQESAS